MELVTTCTSTLIYANYSETLTPLWNEAHARPDTLIYF